MKNFSEQELIELFRDFEAERNQYYPEDAADILPLETFLCDKGIGVKDIPKNTSQYSVLSDWLTENTLINPKRIQYGFARKDGDKVRAFVRFTHTNGDTHDAMIESLTCDHTTFVEILKCDWHW